MLSATRHVRPQRVRLEHHRRVALLGRQAEDVAALDADRAGVGRDEARDRAQQRGLAAAGAAEQRDELAARDVEADVAQHGRGAVGHRQRLDRQVRGHEACRSVRSAADRIVASMTKLRAAVKPPVGCCVASHARAGRVRPPTCRPAPRRPAPRPAARDASARPPARRGSGTPAADRRRVLARRAPGRGRASVRHRVHAGLRGFVMPAHGIGRRACPLSRASRPASLPTAVNSAPAAM